MPSGKEINSTQRKERRILVGLDSAGAKTFGGQQVSVTVNGVGDRTITLTNPAARALVGFVHGAEATATGYTQAGTVSSLQAIVTDGAGTPADLACIVEVVAWDSVDEI